MKNKISLIGLILFIMVVCCCSVLFFGSVGQTALERNDSTLSSEMVLQPVQEDKAILAGALFATVLVLFVLGLLVLEGLLQWRDAVKAEKENNRPLTEFPNGIER